MSLRYLIDTDWAIHYLNGHPAIVTRLNGVKTDGLALSVISLAELYEGVYYSKNPQGNEATLNNFLQGVEIIGVDEETSKRFGKEQGRLRAAGKTTGDFHGEGRGQVLQSHTVAMQDPAPNLIVPCAGLAVLAGFN